MRRSKNLIGTIMSDFVFSCKACGKLISGHSKSERDLKVRLHKKFCNNSSFPEIPDRIPRENAFSKHFQRHYLDEWFVSYGNESALATHL